MLPERLGIRHSILGKVLRTCPQASSGPLSSSSEYFLSVPQYLSTKPGASLTGLCTAIPLPGRLPPLPLPDVFPHHLAQGLKESGTCPFGSITGVTEYLVCGWSGSVLTSSVECAHTGSDIQETMGYICPSVPPST